MFFFSEDSDVISVYLTLIVWMLPANNPDRFRRSIFQVSLERSGFNFTLPACPP